MTDDERIYVRFRGRTLGPLTSQKVHDLIRRGQITRMHELSGDGLSWSKAEEYGDFFPTQRAAQTAEPAAATTQQAASLSADAAAPTSSVNQQAAVEPAAQWYAHIDGENQGPISVSELHQLIESRQVQRQTLVWRSGLEAWQPAEKALPDVFGGSAPTQSGGVDRTFGSFTQASVSRETGSHELSGLAREIDRRRGWAFFLGITSIVVSSLWILGHFFVLFVAASGSAAGANAAPALIMGIIGIAFAGTVMTIGIMILQYCGKVKDFALHPTSANALMAARCLSSLWAFTGIASLIWLVVSVSIVIVVLSLSLSVIDALT